MPKVLDPKQFELSDNVSFFGHVRGWWFDRKEGQSQTGTAPTFLRVVEDDICICPQCREGFQMPNYTDELCHCFKIHNLIFKCSQK